MERSRVRRRGRSLALVVLVLAALLVASQDLWLPLVGRFLVVEDPLRHADAVVPLAGEPQRAVYAAELVRAGLADRLVITPLPLPTAAERERHLREMTGIALRRDVPEDAILYVRAIATSTHGEAVNVRRFAEEHGLRSLVVTTSPWHTRRSKWIFRNVFRGSPVVLSIVPLPERVYALPDLYYRPDSWWNQTWGRRHTASEYLKLAAYALGVR